MADFGFFLLVLSCLALACNVRCQPSAQQASELEVLLNIDYYIMNDLKLITNEQFEKLERRLEKLESRSDVVQDKALKSEILAAVNAENQILRQSVVELEANFGGIKENFEDALSEINEEIRHSNEAIEERLAQNAKTVKEQLNDMNRTVLGVDGRVKSEQQLWQEAVGNLENKMTIVDRNQTALQDNLESFMSDVAAVTSYTNASIDAIVEYVLKQHGNFVLHTDKKQKFCFTASLSYTRKYNNGARIIYDYELHRFGKVFDPNTGIFTAPRNGTYLFSVSVEGSSRYSASALLRDEDGERMMVYSNRNGITASNTCVIFLEEGKKVWVEAITKSEFKRYSATFVGVLLG